MLAARCVDQRDKEFFMIVQIPLTYVHNFVGRLLKSCSNICIFLQNRSQSLTASSFVCEHFLLLCHKAVNLRHFTMPDGKMC